MEPNKPAKSLLQGILENQSTAVLWLDGALRLAYLNPAAKTLLRLDGRQALGNPITDCLPHAREFAAALDRKSTRLNSSHH